MNLSAARLNQDKRSEAAQAAQYAIDVDSTNPKGFWEKLKFWRQFLIGYFRLAKALSASKDYDTALEAINTALKVTENFLISIRMFVLTIEAPWTPIYILFSFL